MRQRIRKLGTAKPERQRTAKALRSEGEKYRILVEESPLGVSIIGKDGHYKYINPKFTEIFGYTLEDIPTGQQWFQEAYPDREYRKQAITTWITDLTTSKRGEARPRTFLVRCKDGSEKVVYFRAVTMETGDQFVIYEDITERNRMEEALRESEEFSNSLLTNSPHPVAVINPDTSIRYVNPALERLTGFSSAELIGRKAPYPWWTTERLQQIGQDFQEAMRTGAQKLEQLFQKKNGERFWVEITSIPVTSDGPLKHFLSNWVDITERKRTGERLRELAMHDILTNLPNRRLFKDRLELALAQAKRHDYLTAICYLDLDDFKPINDSLGHENGDQLLVAVAERLADCVREEDTIARLGGDEFSIIIQGANQLQDVVLVAERIMDCFTEPFSLNEHEAMVTASMGISVYPTDAKNSEALLNHADSAMYSAKARGKNQYQFYHK